MRYPTFTLGKVLLKPLLPPKSVVDADHALRILQRDVLKKIRGAIKTQDTFSDRAKKALAKSLRAEIKGSSIKITTNHPAFAPLVHGMPTQQMTWLTKAKAPIPIITEQGKLIFRSATPKSMADGRWIHPGHKPTNLLEKARKAAREYVRDKITGELAKQIRQALQKAASA
jgi:hypothetical protein